MMVCDRGKSADAVMLAALHPVPAGLSVAVPKLVPPGTPSKKVTVPVGCPPAPHTVAVNVTAWPNCEGLADDVTVVVVRLRKCQFPMSATSPHAPVAPVNPAYAVGPTSVERSTAKLISGLTGLSVDCDANTNRLWVVAL